MKFSDGFDFNDMPRAPEWNALIGQLIECLKWYEVYLTDFIENDFRFEEELKKATAYRRDLESWFPVEQPDEKRIRDGLRVYDGGKAH